MINLHYDNDRMETMLRTICSARFFAFLLVSALFGALMACGEGEGNDPIPLPFCTERTPDLCSDEECGLVDDGCGGTMDCGACGDGECEPLTVEECRAEQCGDVADGCGGTIDCGACGSSCEPVDPCSANGWECGGYDDGCGRDVECGVCTGRTACDAGVCVDVDPFEDVVLWRDVQSRGLWIKVVPTVTGTLGALSVEGPCSGSIVYFTEPELKAGEYLVLEMIESRTASCDAGEYEIVFDFYEEGMSTVQMQTMELSASEGFWTGEPVLSNVEAFSGPSGYLRFSAHAERALTVSSGGIYRENGTFLQSGYSTSGYAVAAGQGLIETLFRPPAEEGTYYAYFWGNDLDGKVYFQYFPFEFSL